MRSVSEIKQLLWRDLQHLAELEDHVEGNAYVSQLNGADMTAVDVHQLGQLELGELFPLPIKNHIQTEFSIQLLVLFPYFRHLCQYLRGVFCEYKPCKTSVTLLTQVVSLATMSVLYRKGDIFMKKAICFLLALAMMLSLCACGGASANNADADGENTAPQQEQQKTKVRAFIAAVKKNTDLRELDAAVLRAFIDRIECSYVDKKSRTQEITIVYTIN